MNKIYLYFLLVVFSFGFTQAQEGSYCTYTQSQFTSRYINNFWTEAGEENISNLNSGYSPNGYQDATDMVVKHYAGGTLLFGADFEPNDDFTSYGFAIFVDWNQDYEFSNEERVYASGTYVTSVDSYFAIPEDISPGTYRMRIVADWLYENPPACGDNIYGGEAEDYTVEVTDAPSCLPPVDIRLTYVSADSATVTWTDRSGANQWELLYGEKGFDPDEGIMINIEGENTALLENLDSSSEYSVYVRAVCSESNSDFTIPSFDFLTTCNTVQLPYFEDFESVTAPELPECTREENLGSGLPWEVYEVDSNGFNGNVLTYKYGSNIANTWFFTQGFELTAGETYTLKFDYGNSYIYYTESMKVSIGQSPLATAMDNVLVDYPEINSGEKEEAEIEFTVDESGIYYIGFHAYSDTFQEYLYLDNISLTAKSMGIHSINQSEIKLYPNPAQDFVTIQSKDSIDSITLTNMTGQKVAVPVSKNSLNSAQLDISHLAKGIYFIQVKSGLTVENIKLIKK